jgi:sulfoxide reductase heme-binding subunit YedZ
VLAAELTLLVYASFSLRRRIGARNWRRLHWAAYAIFAAATAHGIAAGTDSAQPWALSVYLGAIGAVAAAAAWRALVPPASATTQIRA